MNKWNERAALHLVNSLLQQERICPDTHRRAVELIRQGAYDDALTHAMRRSAVE